MDSFDVYEPGARRIYSYFDGEKVVAADPMVLWRNLMEVRGDLSAHLSLAFAPMDSKDKPQAYAKAAALSRKIFSVREFHEGGLTEAEAVNLVQHFWRYCDGVKKNSPPSPSWSAATSAAPAPTSDTSER